MRKRYQLIIFLFIVSIAFITRFYKLGVAPHGLYLDEAAQGYNAYSILLTGKDEFGKAYPTIFRSFTDFKTPVYIYMITPLIPIFGLTKFAVRFPSFFLSILTFPFLYLLIKNITSKEYANKLALTTSLLLAVSPWHILFSRTNFECNVALFFLLAGAYFYYQGFKKPILFIPSALLWAISIPSYHSERIITPLLVIILAIRHKDILWKNRKAYLYPVLLGVILGTIVLLPTFVVATTPGFWSRATTLNIFKLTTDSTKENVLFALINNKIFLSIKEFISLYVSYLSPRNMFILGDYGPRSSFPELATFFVWQVPFYFLGIYKLYKDKKLGEIRCFCLSLLLIAPIPAALTRDPYSTIRALPLVIPQLIIIALGIIYFYEKIKTRTYRYLSILIFAVAIIWSILKLYSSVLVLNEYYRAYYWDYGWEEVAEVIKNTEDLPIVVDNTRFIPYSQLVFFLKYDPAAFQEANGIDPHNYYRDMSTKNDKDMGRLQIRPIFWESDLKIEQYLIGDYLAISEEQTHTHRLELIKEITYPDGSTAFRIVKTSKK